MAVLYNMAMLYRPASFVNCCPGQFRAGQLGIPAEPTGQGGLRAPMEDCRIE